VIHKTFQPLIGSNKELPKDLAPRLLHRFSSNEGYMLSPGVGSLLRLLKQQQQQGCPRIVAGVITNSDDRVPGILSSLGLRVSPFRFGSSSIYPVETVGQQYDVDLHCMSYDVGSTKPDKRIFDAAEEMANRLLAAQQGFDPDGDKAGSVSATLPWLKVFVGDEYEKDIVGARNAGWNAVFVGAEGGRTGEENSLNLKQEGNMTLEEVFPQGACPVLLRAENTEMFLEWLVSQYSGEGRRWGGE
jgi:FMN phosphatase YigB (HAD superfamily)